MKAHLLSTGQWSETSSQWIEFQLWAIKSTSADYLVLSSLALKLWIAAIWDLCRET